MSFSESFFASLSEAKAEIGFRAYFPWVFIITVIFPILILYVVNPGASSKITASELISVLSAMAVVSGILCAFSISAMTQIQQIASAYPFSDYLKEEKLFDSFIYFPQFTFVVQFFSVLVNAISIILFVIFECYSFEILIFNFGILLYTSYNTFGLVDLIRRLTWHYARYMILYNKE